jgi:hypothetical protein
VISTSIGVVLLAVGLVQLLFFYLPGKTPRLTAPRARRAGEGAPDEAPGGRDRRLSARRAPRREPVPYCKIIVI